jgi:hypothetical protein
MNPVTHLEENLGAMDLTLTSEHLLEIDTAASTIKVQGERLSEPPEPQRIT